MNSTTITDAQLAQVQGYSIRDAAKILGVGKSSIQRARQRKSEKGEAPTATTTTGPGYRFEQGTDGNIDVQTRPSDAPLLPSEIEKLLADKGIDPSLYNVSYGFSEWEAQGPEGEVKKLVSTRVRATPKPAGQSPKLNTDELLATVDKLSGVKYYEIPGVGIQQSTFVICPSDMQVGKTSYNGGTDETIKRVMRSYENARRFLAQNPQREIIIAELGDPLENFYNTSSQRETNDLDLTGQVRVARRLLLEGIKVLAPYAPKLTYVTVPSNHGTVRVGFKAPAGDSHNDWGLEISHQLEDVTSASESLRHVEFVRPEHLHESVNYETSGTNIGFVHGHQSRAAEKLGDWWKGQVHGRGPTEKSDILLAGHWHSFRVQQSGASKWVMVSPAQDPGSDWFTELTGERSRTGMLSFTTHDGKWDNLTIY